MRSIALLTFMCLTSLVDAQAQTPNQEEWNHYFNARFLPEQEAEKAFQKLKDPGLKSAVHASPSLATEEAQFSAEKPVHTNQLLERAPATAAEPAAVTKVSTLDLPTVIQSAEAGGDAEVLKVYYRQYRDEVPLHSNVYHYARALLRSTGPSGILVVQGQLDTYPLRALQLEEGFRNDIVIVNLQWLREQPQYRAHIAQQLGIGQKALNVHSEEIINALWSQSGRSVFVSMTVAPEILSRLGHRLVPHGLSLQLDANENKIAAHRTVLEYIPWEEVTAPGLPEYVEALQQNYVAALLVDEKMGNTGQIAGRERDTLLKALYKQRGLEQKAKQYRKRP